MQPFSGFAADANEIHAVAICLVKETCRKTVRERNCHEKKPPSIVILGAVFTVMLSLAFSGSGSADNADRATKAVTYTKDVGSILNRNCIVPPAGRDRSDVAHELQRSAAVGGPFARK